MRRSGRRVVVAAVLVSVAGVASVIAYMWFDAATSVLDPASIRPDDPIAQVKPVLVLTTFADDGSITRALGGGAAGFLLKTGDPQEIIAGVRAVASGAAYRSPLVTRRVLDGLPTTRRAGSAHAHVATLTERARAVLGLVGAGLSNAEIGRRLHVVEGTVKIYVSTILGRLGARNRVQAAIVAHGAGLIPPDV